MTAFTEIYQQLDWHQLAIQINSKSAQEVEKPFAQIDCH